MTWLTLSVCPALAPLVAQTQAQFFGRYVDELILHTKETLDFSAVPRREDKIAVQLQGWLTDRKSSSRSLLRSGPPTEAGNLAIAGFIIITLPTLFGLIV